MTNQEIKSLILDIQEMYEKVLVRQMTYNEAREKVKNIIESIS